MVIASKQTATVALGGGGARGIAHLGVVESLQATPMDIKRYVGVSIGALAGALCAADSDTSRVQRRVVDYLTSERFQTKQAALFSAAPKAEEPATSGLFAWYNQIRKYLGARRKLATLFGRPGLLGPDVMQDVVDALIPDIDITETTTPLSIVALDLLSGRRVVLTRGSLKTAVMASAAIPGVFPPIATGDMLLCDIGMMDALPAKLAKSYGAALTIAVDVGGSIEPITACETAADMMLRLSDIGEPLVREYSQAFADVIIRPDVSLHPWYDFSDPRSLIELGRAAVQRSSLPAPTFTISRKHSPAGV